jgi:hypothetical protein
MTIDVLNCSISFQLGNGEITKFWHDRWMDQPLKLTYLDLYRNCYDPNKIVAEIYDRRIWALQVEAHNTQETATQHQQLMDQLRRIMVQHGSNNVII